MNNLSIFNIDDTAGVPKYRQLINSVCIAIEQGIISKGDKLPSVNQLCDKFSLSRDTVLVAFNELKSNGIVSSVPGKGYYIERTDLTYDKQIFLLFDELNVFKEDLYASFLEHLDKRIKVDIFFHHFNYNVYKDLISNAAGKYGAYIIMPATFDHSLDLVKKLPFDKVYILDRCKPDLTDYPVIYQDFEQDVYDGMTEGKDLFLKYQKLIMVFPGGKEPEERVTGFLRFCREWNVKAEIIRSLEKRNVQKGEAYLVVSDRNLVKIVKNAAAMNLKLGVDAGLVSFNDTMLKEVVGSGITTISTDFVQMGKELAEMVSRQSNIRLRNSSRLIIRQSL
ncbi:MAG TPA: GntR family transcriptional regulator [Prolixibacteraceae bacterium]|nr:GntR family transcriptional regulator [Prolixibacteraceae bacterium]